jgi:predicted nucleic acid-binding protein
MSPSRRGSIRALCPRLAFRERSLTRTSSSTLRIPATPGKQQKAVQIISAHARQRSGAVSVRCAKLAGCGELLTEDRRHGQVIDGVRIVNPFL